MGTQGKTSETDIDGTTSPTTVPISRRSALRTVGVGVAGVLIGASGTASAADFAGGDGSEANPYEIETWEQLDAVGLDGHYLLTADLGEETAGYDEYASANANGGEGWNPIDFDGTFDGDGHTISGLFIDRTGIGDNQIGLFGAANLSTIENVELAVLEVTGNNQVGALVGLGGTVRNCHASGPVTAADDIQASMAGGLVGDLRGSIERSSATGRVVGDISVGGLVGSTRGSITDSHATGPVDGAMSFLGGLAGDNRGVIESSWATGNVTGVASGWDSTGVGGLVGRNTDDGVIENAYARGTATIELPDSDNNVGALVGENLQTAEIRTSYAAGTASGFLANEGGVAGSNEATVTDVYYNADANESAFGETDGESGIPSGLSTEEMQGDAAVEHMDALDFTDIWEAVDDDYPVLRMDTDEDENRDGSGEDTDETDGVDDSDDADDGVPGPGIVGTLATLGVTGYLLARRNGKKSDL